VAYDEALAGRIRAALAGDSAVSEKKMFGGLAFLYRSLMFVSVSGSKLVGGAFGSCPEVPHRSTVTWETLTGVIGRSPGPVGVLSILPTTSIPSITRPKTGCFD
jgi:hypothetical protein